MATNARQLLDALLARRQVLHRELVELVARIHDIRAAFGNRFSYSRPDHADEGKANDTGFSSHALPLPTLMAPRRVDAKIARLQKILN